MANNNENLSFGKRFGLVPIEIPFQLKDIDTTLRIELWNAYYQFVESRIKKIGGRSIEVKKSLWAHFFIKALDDFPGYDSFGYFVKQYIEIQIWYKVYEFFEAVLNLIEGDPLFYKTDFEKYINIKLRNNNSAYTLFNNRFIQLTNETEINEIKITQTLSSNYNLSGIQEHLNSSIELLSLKPNPDFRNSIKESISMVEVISRIIEPSENTLGKALNKLNKNQKINGTLKSGFEKLYNYTNDGNGIRHGLMEDQNVDIEDAKFFLVSCSAFTNYLIEKAIKENLLVR